MSEVAVLHELSEDYNLVVLGDDIFNFGKHNYFLFFLYSTSISKLMKSVMCLNAKTDHNHPANFVYCCPLLFAVSF